MLLVDSSYKVIDINHTPKGLLCTAGEIVGMDVREVFSPTCYNGENLHSALDRVFRGEERRVELSRVQVGGADGETRYWSLKISPVLLPKKDMQVLIQIDDITKTAGMEEDFHTLREINESIVQTIPSGILVLDLEGRILLTNKAAEIILETPADQMEGRLHQDVLDIRIDLPDKENKWQFESLIGRNVLKKKLGGGKTLTIGYSRSPLKNSQGDQTGTIIVFQDLTEIHLLKNRLIQSEKMAGIGTLASGIAHEFNNLIGGMMGYAQLASATGEKEDFQKAIEVVFTSSKRAKEIITNLLTFSRRTAHETELISMEALIRQVLTLVERDLQKSNVEIKSSIDSDIRIRTDVGQVQQVLMNLVINAQHAMPNGGRLSISTAMIADEIHVRVADTGIGIPEENITRIFEPFFTTKGSIGTGKEEGTGLGLSLSYGLIKDLGGEIRVESKEELGSTFTVILPNRIGESDGEMCGEEGQNKGRKKDSQETVERFQLNILVVDDDRTTLELIDQVLTREGHRVVTAPTGFMAIEKARGVTYDLMFVDAVMPGIDGIETLTSLRDMLPDAMAIMITGSLGEELENLHERLEPLNAHVLRKPFEIPSILKYSRRLEKEIRLKAKSSLEEGSN